MAELSSFRLHPGDRAPDFALPGVDGRTYHLGDFDAHPFLVVTFWCNHCPYVVKWTSRAIDLQRRFAKEGVQFVMINANDAVSYPTDGMGPMVEMAREKRYPFPYLRDDSQEVARAYGALVTPHPMLFGKDRTLLFQGKIDDNPDQPEAARSHYLSDAIAAAIAGRPIAQPELPVLGCSVKWRA
jgi:peroxiredoxin